MPDYYKEHLYVALLKNSTIAKAGKKWRLIANGSGFGTNAEGALILSMCDGRHRILDILKALMAGNKKGFMDNLRHMTEFLHVLESKGLIRLSDSPKKTSISIEEAKVHSEPASCPYIKCKECNPDSFNKPMLFPYPECAGKRK